MTWSVDKYGFAEDLSDVPAHELDKRFPLGRGLYATLAGFAKAQRLHLTAFERPLQIEPIYEAREAWAATENGRQIRDLTPILTESRYQVTFFDGEIRWPPLWPNEVQELGYAKMLEETGERVWHMASVDSNELTVFFTGSTRNEILGQVLSAVRKLYPDYESLAETLRQERDLAVTFGTAHASDRPNNAALLRAEDGSAKFFGADDEHELQGEVLGVLTQMTDAEGDMFDLAEAAGLRIEVGYLWLSDGLVDEAIRQRRAREEGPQP